MAAQQRVHPAVADIQQPRPTEPLMRRVSFASDKGNPPPPSYHPHPLRHIDAPVMMPMPPKRRGSFCYKCFCWTISLLIILLILLGVTIVVLYVVFKPKIPEYSVDKLTITNFSLNLNMSLYARFDVKITTTNPNTKIEIYYESGSRLSVWYTNTELCKGTLPKFYQAPGNTTKLDVILEGQNQYGSALMSALLEQQQTGQIPLDLKVDVPVSIKLGSLKLKAVRFLVGCNLVVDNLSANNLISIKESSCQFNSLKL